jgi:hypothetical protein
MIFLRKSAEPRVLAENKHVWTRELLAGDDSALVARRYASFEIKTAIIAETHGKCAYCESKPLHVAYGDVEHIVPKKVDKTLAFEWANLTLACDICNTRKGMRTDIFDPYADNPELHFWFYGPLMFNTLAASDDAKITLVVLFRDRPALIEKRSEKIKDLQRQLQIVQNAANAELRALLTTELVGSASEDASEYAACNRAFIGFLRSIGEL